MATCRVRQLGVSEYLLTVDRMRRFTDQRGEETADEIWLLEHPPVFTQGTSCYTHPRQNPDRIPVVHSGRGGQMTYHGPGQLVAYLLFDIKRLGIGPKALVGKVEEAIMGLLAQYGLTSERKCGAPGVYIDGEKIAALGLRIRNGRCFHGLSLNIDMDIRPFTWIDPCGYHGLTVTQLAHFGIHQSLPQVGVDLMSYFGSLFPWEGISWQD